MNKIMTYPTYPTEELVLHLDHDISIDKFMALSGMYRFTAGNAYCLTCHCQIAAEVEQQQGVWQLVNINKFITPESSVVTNPIKKERHDHHDPENA